MANQLVPDTPQVYYRAVSTDGWPVTITLDNKQPIDQLAVPVAGFQPGQSIVATTPNTPSEVINVVLPAPAPHTVAITRQGVETVREGEAGTWASLHL